MIHVGMIDTLYQAESASKGCEYGRDGNDSKGNEMD